jgi:hypothetical protein
VCVCVCVCKMYMHACVYVRVCVRMLMYVVRASVKCVHVRVHLRAC